MGIMLLFVILLIIMAIAIIFIIISELRRENNKTFSIEEVKNELEKENDNIIKKDYEGIEEYENEQEKKAIISYEELLENASKLELDYGDEEDIPDLSIHKVDLKENEEVITEKQDITTYKDEEEYLNKLKEFRADL